jgi:hypothetical protein
MYEGCPQFGVGRKLVHQLSNDTSPIHLVLFGVGNKQGARKDENDIVQNDRCNPLSSWKCLFLFA